MRFKQIIFYERGINLELGIEESFRLLETLVIKNRHYTREGNLPVYIPGLMKANPTDLGIYVTTLDGTEFWAGEWEKMFTLQSISKIIALMLAIIDQGQQAVFKKVGVEPTADAFNSIVSLETKNLQRPLNPMINSGAIVTVSLIAGNTRDEIFNRIIAFARELMNNPQLDINQDVYLSERETGHRNRALAYFMKSTGLIEKEVEDVLDVYFKQCSIECNTRDIARLGAVLANKGVLPWNGKRLISEEVAKIIKTIMLTCGMYDASGEIAVNIGIPCKSGVGGGIVAVAPERMGLGVYSPALDGKGNSRAGIKLLKELSDDLNLSIF